MWCQCQVAEYVGGAVLEVSKELSGRGFFQCGIVNHPIDVYTQSCNPAIFVTQECCNCFLLAGEALESVRRLGLFPILVTFELARELKVVLDC